MAPQQSPPFQSQAPLLLPASSTASSGPATRSTVFTAASQLLWGASGRGLGSTQLTVTQAPKMQGAHLLGHAVGTSPGALTPLGMPLSWRLALHAPAVGHHVAD